MRGQFASRGFSPLTFFVANGIAKTMATEIWDDLQGGVLSSAANLTKPEQVSLLARRLISLKVNRPIAHSFGRLHYVLAQRTPILAR